VDGSPVIRVLMVARRDSQDPLGAGLKRAGYAVLRADSGVVGARSLERSRADVVIVNERGFDRKEADLVYAAAARHDVPILAISPPTAGAPSVSSDAIVRRLQALLAGPGEGRAEASAAHEEIKKLTVGVLVVDLEQHIAAMGGTALQLTAREFDFLCCLARQPGRVWSRQQLIDLVWGHDYVDPHLVTVHMANLRKKLGRAAEHEGTAGIPRLEVMRSVGYRLVCPDNPPLGPATVAPGDLTVGDPAAPFGSRQPGRLPFVGRQQEMQVLRGMIDTTLAGVTRSVAIVGDPGIGKTRLAEEVAAYAREAGACVYWGRCRDASVKPAYEPWVEILRQWSREDPKGGFDQVFTPSPGDIRLPSDGEGARLRLFEKLADAVRRKSEAGTLCLILDDLHWADPSTLLALQHVLGHLGEAPVALLVTYRPHETAPSPFLTEVINDLVRGDLGPVLLLRPLSQSEVNRFVELSGLEDRVPAPPPGTPRVEYAAIDGVHDLASEVYRETEGNPFFLTQLVRLHLLAGESPGSLPDRRTLSREEGVRRVVLNRLLPLSQSCRETLDAASVIGREFTQPVLAGTIDLAPKLLLERLGEAVDANLVLVQEDAPEECRFVHSIFQEVLRTELSPQRRATLHAKVARVLEHLHGHELDAYAADLAYHFSEAVPAGFVSEAIDHCLRAGRVAAHRCAWEEACLRFRRAIDLLELLPAEPPDKKRGLATQAWEELGDVYYVLVDTVNALEAYEHALRRIPCEERLLRARLLEKIAEQHTDHHHYDLSTACLTEAETLLGPPRENAEVAWLDTWMTVQWTRGWVYFHEGRLDELYDLLQRVDREVVARGSPRERAQLQDLRMHAEWTRHRFVSTDDILALAEDCARNFGSTGSPVDAMRGERALGRAYLWSPERRRDAHDYLVHLYDQAKREHSGWDRLVSLWYLEIWHRLEGEVDAVRAYGLETLSLMTDPPGVWSEFGGEARGHLSWVAWREGNLGQARELAIRALKEIRGEAFSPVEWQARWTLLGLALRDQDWAEAAGQAAVILDPVQQKMPDDLEELMRRLVDEQARDRAPGPGTVEALTATARTCGYL